MSESTGYVQLSREEGVEEKEKNGLLRQASLGLFGEEINESEGTASFGSVTLNLLNTIIGGGMLAIPFCFKVLQSTSNKRSVEWHLGLYFCYIWHF
jgi:hypothetical protein